MNKQPLQTLASLALISIMSIHLTACNSVGNVVPQEGPSMEQVYDDMGHTNAKGKPTQSNSTIANTDDDDNVDANPYEANMTKIRGQVNPGSTTKTNLPNQVPANSTWKSFHKEPNPSLHLYVYPHLAGNDELPVPGYTTAFNAYEQDHYVLFNAL